VNAISATVCASFDGVIITLRAPREHADHWVGLEPFVFAELSRFASGIGWDRLIKELSRQNEE
jgi:hypothetical protein